MTIVKLMKPQYENDIASKSKVSVHCDSIFIILNLMILSNCLATL